VKAEFDIHVDERTVSYVVYTVERRAKEYGVSVLDSRALTARDNCQGEERLTLREKQALVKHATRDKTQRFKPWMVIYEEIRYSYLHGKKVSRPTIFKAFRSMGCERCVPRKKPYLDEKQRETRYQWYLARNLFRWDLVMYTDECGVQKGITDTHHLCTRTPEEEWHDDCVDPNFKEQTGLMFAGAIATGWKGVCVIYDPESKAEREAAIQLLKESAEPEYNRRVAEWNRRWAVYKEAKARKEDMSLSPKERRAIRTGPQPPKNPPKLLAYGPMRSEGGGID